MLSLIIFIHEFGHFIIAKKCGVYVDEFALGMGPVLFKYKPKNSETTYSLRAVPIGGFVAMAEKLTPEVKLKKNQVLENKSTIQKLAVLIMGIIMNFILAILLFFISGLLYGKPIDEPVVGTVLEGAPAYEAGIEKGDFILEINGVKIDNWDDVLLEIAAKELKDSYEFVVEKADGKTYKYDIVPLVEKTEDGETRTFGMGTAPTKYEKGFGPAVSYAFGGFVDTIRSIARVVKSLFTGEVAFDSLSGPVGVYSVIDTLKSQGLQAMLYLTAYLSVNVGVINLLPIPVFDGGRILLVLIEMITRKKASEKVEIILNYIGFGLMILLMLYVTFNDISNLIG